MTTMPAIFIGHGSPMNTLERNRYTDAWRALAASLPRPRAVLAVSAHWYLNATAVTAMARPRVIHDFFGFPDELFAFDYPAPGAPGVAEEVVEALAPRWVGLDHDSWGIDHGTWSVLAHLFPEADVPVVQLSVNAAEPPAYHLELGQRLAPLTERGILVLGSGNVVHNLRRIDWSRPEGAFDWAERFDDRVRELMTSTPGEVASVAEHPDFPMAVPSPDHFLPLLYVAGVADALGCPVGVPVHGYAYGSLSMTCYSAGRGDLGSSDEAGPAASLPHPEVVPPAHTNT
jgi:4,5-DOPA dioxygenase extradiol